MAPKPINASVTQQLRVSDTGIGQYMKTEQRNGQEMHILPSPRYAALVAQASTPLGENIRIAPVGEAGGLEWGIVLDSQGDQYGMQMSYDLKDLQSRPQVIYVGTGDYFSRSNMQEHTTGSAKKRKRKGKHQGKITHTVDIELFEPPKGGFFSYFTGKGSEGKPVIPVRYDRLKGSASLQELNDFQGFIAVNSAGEQTAYDIWMTLNADQLQRAASTRNYQDVARMLGSRYTEKTYFFIEGNEQFDASLLEQRIADANRAAKESKKAKDPTPTESKRKKRERERDLSMCTVSLYSGDDSADFEFKPGTYSIENLITDVSEKPTRGRTESGIVYAVMKHLLDNNPFSISGREVTKRGTVNLKAGKTYQLRMGRVVESEPPVQPMEQPKAYKAPKQEDTPPKEPPYEPPKDEPKPEPEPQEELPILTPPVKPEVENIDPPIPPPTFEPEPLPWEDPVQEDKELVGATASPEQEPWTQPEPRRERKQQVDSYRKSAIDG